MTRTMEEMASDPHVGDVLHLRGGGVWYTVTGCPGESHGFAGVFVMRKKLTRKGDEYVPSEEEMLLPIAAWMDLVLLASSTLARAAK